MSNNDGAWDWIGLIWLIVLLFVVLGTQIEWTYDGVHHKFQYGKTEVQK